MRRLMLAGLAAAVLVGAVPSVEAQTVATSSLIQRAKLPVGKTDFPTFTIDRVYSRVVLQIDPFPADWADPDFLVTVELYEFVGGEWKFWTGSTWTGNTFRKDGSLPAIEFNTSDMPPVGSQFKGSITINASKRVGLILTLETPTP